MIHRARPAAQSWIGSQRGFEPAHSDESPLKGSLVRRSCRPSFQRRACCCCIASSSTSLAALKLLRATFDSLPDHEYIEVTSSPRGFTAPTRLDMNSRIAAAVSTTIRKVAPKAAIWGGEIGPHNGGNPVCDQQRTMRWAVYGDTLWYADALATKAKHGYTGFCRQDYIGADYGLVDCLTGAPLPDYWMALTFTRTMGMGVLEASLTSPDDLVSLNDTSTGTDGVARAYAHCTARLESTAGVRGSVSVLVINLANQSTTVRFDASLGDVARAYVLEGGADAASSMTGQAGLMGTGIRLNGKLLTLGAGGDVPPLMPAIVHGTSAIAPPHSVAFFVLPAAGHADCP